MTTLRLSFPIDRLSLGAIPCWDREADEIAGKEGVEATYTERPRMRVRLYRFDTVDEAIRVATRAKCRGFVTSVEGVG